MKKLCNNICFLGLLLILGGVVTANYDKIQTFYIAIRNYLNPNIELSKNKYYRDYDYKFVHNTDNFKAENYNDLLNITYSILNSGQTEGNFICSKDYKNCLDDVARIAHNSDLLTCINNYVHPYNSFKHIEIEMNSLGFVTIYIAKNYDDDVIEQLNKKVDEIDNYLFAGKDLDQKTKLKLLHDYIIEHSKYDSVNALDESNINIHTAIGPLLDGKAVCSGYTDAFALFLNKYNINNYRVSSATHTWNAVYLDGKWYHIDLTWDDPITTYGFDVVLHDYFMVETEQLLHKDITEHTFDKTIYLEL